MLSYSCCTVCLQLTIIYARHLLAALLSASLGKKARSTASFGQRRPISRSVYMSIGSFGRALSEMKRCSRIKLTWPSGLFAHFWANDLASGLAAYKSTRLNSRGGPSIFQIDDPPGPSSLVEATEPNQVRRDCFLSNQSKPCLQALQRIQQHAAACRFYCV
jgi:hypothetical protein